MIGDKVIQMIELHGYCLTSRERDDVRLAVKLEAIEYAAEVVEPLSDLVKALSDVVVV